MIDAYVINLDRREDRLKSIDVPFKYTRFPAVDGSSLTDYPLKIRGVIGCLKSHIALLEHVKVTKNDMTLVLEDDAVLCDDFDVRFDHALKSLPEDWDLLYLGGWNVGEIKKHDDVLDVAEKIYTTHAYVIRDKFIDVVLNALKSREWKADVLLAECLSLGKCFICNPVLVWQREGYSDIVNKNTNNTHLR